MSQAASIAHWSFEEAGPFGPGYLSDIVADEGEVNDLDFSSVTRTYQSSADVPPSSMFAAGYSAGNRSFDAGSLANNDGIVFVDGSDNGTNDFITDDWTLEAFFKVTDTSLLGYNGSYPYGGRNYVAGHPDRWGLMAGADGTVGFSVSGLGNGLVRSQVSFQENQWVYAAASFRKGEGGVANTLTLRVLVEGNSNLYETTATWLGSPESPWGDLTVGANSTVWGHLPGLVDELRFSDSVLPDDQLLALPGTVPIDYSSLSEFRQYYPLKPVRSYTFLGTENSVHELWETATRYSKPVVEPNGIIVGWLDPSAHVTWLKSAMASGAYDFGLVDGYLPAVHYTYSRAGTDSTCEMTAFAVDGEEPGSIFIHVALVEKDGGDTVSSQYFKLGCSEDSSQAEFDAALQALRTRWEAFFAEGKDIPIPDPDVLNACKASIIRALITFTGKRPHYGVRSYGPGEIYGPDFGDGFPPTIISLVDCLLDWGQAPLAREYFAAYINDFIRDDGRARYYYDDGVDGCSVAEYGQFLWLASKCMDTGGSREWFAPLRPKLERIRANAWAAASAHPDGLIPGCGEADLRTQIGIYFHNNGWMWRGLRDIAPLLGHSEDAQRCAEFEQTIKASIESVVDRSGPIPFIPPMPEKTDFNVMTPFESMTAGTYESYSNYRYWPELMSSGILNNEQADAIIAYRKAYGGEVAGMTAFRDWADNWPIAEHAKALMDLGLREETRTVLFSHLAGHMTPETWTAYEQVATSGTPYRGIKANYCVPAQLVAPRLAAWLWGAPLRISFFQCDEDGNRVFMFTGGEKGEYVLESRSSLTAFPRVWHEKSTGPHDPVTDGLGARIVDPSPLDTVGYYRVRKRHIDARSASADGRDIRATQVNEKAAEVKL